MAHFDALSVSWAELHLFLIEHVEQNNHWLMALGVAIPFATKFSYWPARYDILGWMTFWWFGAQGYNSLTSNIDIP